ncbi:ABC transporter substrate-binding protein [Streptomyces sp. TP-A0874]|uniref:ABC transporter substrate-binding protein n=1 Tax=Streptomyces sp. TP-A0874 TaxID=549819 RepID=UPI000AFFBD1C|nr:ABC transporter substrate-binding protein [Streptomyces sp. TP-A0874]
MGRGSQAVVYDAKAWRRAGVQPPRGDWTWAEWADAMRRLTRASGKVGSVDPGHAEDWFEIWLRGRGKALYTADGRLGFTAADLAEWWEMTDALRREGVVSSAQQTTQLDGSVENTPLGRLQALTDVNWDAPASGFQAVIGEEVGLAPAPVGEDGTPGQYYKPSMFVGASANSTHPEEAVALVDFLVNDPAAAEILGASRGIPANDALREKLRPELAGFDRTVAAYQQGLEGRLDPPPPAPPKGDNALQSTFQRDYDQVIFGRKTPREAAEEFITEAEAELRQ